nr:hypothetical protein [Tanacetum cinerariifolium]
MMYLWLMEFFDGAFGGDGEEDFVMKEGVVVSSSLLDISTKSCLGGMMVSLILLEELEEKAWVESMEVEVEWRKFRKLTGAAYRNPKESLHPILTIPLLPDFGCVTDWYQEPRIMPPRRLRKKAVKKLAERRMAKAIEEYEKTKADSINAGGFGSTSTGGSADVQGCSY